ncbi:MAG: hypothetical protein GY745_10700 [Actinomycetia bacterium]|nr:hypothetical protein [Actinomycetes bacterium]
MSWETSLPSFWKASAASRSPTPSSTRLAARMAAAIPAATSKAAAQGSGAMIRMSVPNAI